MVELRNVTKVYRTGAFGRGKLTAVEGVTFKLEHGKVISLIGESGSGKSTIGRMILKLISTTSGQIMLDGKDIAALKGRALKNYYKSVQGVFQDPFSTYNPIFKADRIFDIIRAEYFGSMKSRNWREKVNSSLQSVGLAPEQVLNKFPHQLSGGQLQRLLIARALLMEVDILIADEIISMLDASTRVDVLNLLIELKDRGLSILFITHDLSLGYYISDYVVILYRGSIAEMGDTERVFYNPIHPYTRMLLTSVPRLDKKWGESEAEFAETQESSEELLQERCKYYDRCPFGDERCKQMVLTEVEENHYTTCARR